MSFAQLIRFERGENLLYNLDPRTKLFFSSLIMIISIIFLEVWFLFSILVFELLIFHKLRKLNLFLSSLKSFILFILLIFFSQIFFANSIYLAISYSLRFLVLMLIFSIFFLTTSPDDLGLAMESLGLPHDISLAFTMAIRFMPVIAMEFQTVYDAQRSRGLELEAGGFRDKLRKYIPIIVPVFISTIRRTYEIADAMDVRAFGAVKNPTRLHTLKMERIDWIIILLSSSLFLVLLLIDNFIGLPKLLPLI